MLSHHRGSRQGYTDRQFAVRTVRGSPTKEVGQGTLGKAYEAMSDYIQVYDYKPETFSGIKYAFTSKRNSADTDNISDMSSCPKQILPIRKTRVFFSFSDWMQPDDGYSIRNLTVEAEADWRFCFPTLNMHHQRSKIDGAKDSFLYYFDVSSELLGGMQGANHCSGKF